MTKLLIGCALALGLWAQSGAPPMLPAPSGPYAIGRVRIQLNAANNRGAVDLKGRMDVSHLAAVGHSLGGFASIPACQLDHPLTACVNEDGGTADGAYLNYGTAAPKQPILYVEASVPSAGTDESLRALGITLDDWNRRLDHMLNVTHRDQLGAAGR